MVDEEDYDLSIANRALSYDSPRLRPIGRVLYLRASPTSFLCLRHILKADKLSKQFFRINKSMNLSYLHLRSLMSHDH